MVIKEVKEEIKAEEEPIIEEEFKAEKPIVIKKAKEEIKAEEEPIVIKETKGKPKKEQADTIKAPLRGAKKPTSFEKECAERVKNITPGKAKLSASMLTGKPKCRCMNNAYDVHCDKDAAEGNKYFPEHIEP